MARMLPGSDRMPDRHISTLGGRWLAAAALLPGILATGGCDAIDPTRVSNPTTTDEDLAQATDQTETHAVRPATHRAAQQEGGEAW